MKNLRDERSYKLARKSKSNDNCELFRQLRNKVIDECRKAKRNYLESRLDKNKKILDKCGDASGAAEG